MKTTKEKLVSAVTQYDAKQSKKSGFNRYALPQYLERVDLVVKDIESGAEASKAIKAGFTGRLADVCLKSLGLSITTKADAFGGSVCYRPVTAQ